MSAPQRVQLFRPGSASTPGTSGLPDLDSAANIERMVDLFYEKVLSDTLLAPLFLEVANIDLDEHLPLISAFWKKLLLGDPSYDRNMIAKHRELDDKEPLNGTHHERWLSLFYANLDEHFEGPFTDRARQLAARIMNNLYEQLSQRKCR